MVFMFVLVPLIDGTLSGYIIQIQHGSLLKLREFTHLACLLVGVDGKLSRITSGL